MDLTLTDVILLSILAVGATWLFCTLAQMLDSSDSPSDEEIAAMLKRADQEVNNRPRVRAITK